MSGQEKEKDAYDLLVDIIYKAQFDKRLDRFNADELLQSLIDFKENTMLAESFGYEMAGIRILELEQEAISEAVRIRAQALLDAAKFLETTMSSESHDPAWYWQQLQEMAGDLINKVHR